MELSALLDPGKQPKTDKSTIVTEAAEVIRRLRADLARVTSILHLAKSANSQKEDISSGLGKDKMSLQHDQVATMVRSKLKIEQQLQNYVHSLPFASPTPLSALPFAAKAQAHQSKMMMANAANLFAMDEGLQQPLLWGLPPIMIHSTTAEEDALLRAPVA